MQLYLLQNKAQNKNNNIKKEEKKTLQKRHCRYNCQNNRGS